jgi:hypothetical protein
MMMEPMGRHEFNGRHAYRTADPKEGPARCGNCRHYMPGERTFAKGCGLMLQCMMTHGEIKVAKGKSVCNLWQERQERKMNFAESSCQA